MNTEIKHPNETVPVEVMLERLSQFRDGMAMMLTKAVEERDSLRQQLAAAERERDAALERLRKAKESLGNHELNPCNYDHDEVCRMNAVWCEAVSILDAAMSADASAPNPVQCPSCGGDRHDVGFEVDEPKPSENGGAE